MDYFVLSTNPLNSNDNVTFHDRINLNHCIKYQAFDHALQILEFQQSPQFDNKTMTEHLYNTDMCMHRYNIA